MGLREGRQIAFDRLNKKQGVIEDEGRKAGRNETKREEKKREERKGATAS